MCPLGSHMRQGDAPTPPMRPPPPCVQPSAAALAALAGVEARVYGRPAATMASGAALAAAVTASAFPNAGITVPVHVHGAPAARSSSAALWAQPGGGRQAPWAAAAFTAPPAPAPAHPPLPHTRAVIHWQGQPSLNDTRFNVSAAAVDAQLAVLNRDFSAAGLRFRLAGLAWRESRAWAADCGAAVFSGMIEGTSVAPERSLNLYLCALLDGPRRQLGLAVGTPFDGAPPAGAAGSACCRRWLLRCSAAAPRLCRHPAERVRCHSWRRCPRCRRGVAQQAR